MSVIHGEVENLWGEDLKKILEDLNIKNYRREDTLKELEKAVQDKELPSKNPFLFDPKELDI